MPIEKNVTKDDDKFLGKEIEYDKLLFRMMSAITDIQIRGGDATNLVTHLEATFPYKDSIYKKNMQKAEEELKTKLSGTGNKYGRDDPQKQRQAISEFTQLKYRELCTLFKRRKKFPQEAETETYE